MTIRKLALAGLLLLVVGIASILLLGRDQATTESGRGHRVIAEHRPATGPEVDTWLEQYNAAYRQLWTAAETARWQASVDVGEAKSRAAVQAAQALADYTGSRQVIDRLQQLRQAPGLTDLQYRQLEKAWLLAAVNPGTVPATVRKRLEVESRQIGLLHGHRYQLAQDGQPPAEVTLGQLDRVLRDGRDLAHRRRAWESGQTVGATLKDGLTELQGLRNAAARSMGFSSHFAIAGADYGLSSRELLLLMDDLHEGLLPLYEQLHCWVRHELAARYGEPVPQLLPVHWLPERWGRTWPQIVDGVDLDGLFRQTSPQWMIEQGERFFVSLGFPTLPLTFWGRSDLYELPADANRRKSTLASTWHIDLDQDVRLLLSMRNDFTWYQALHRELGRGYYCLAYARPEVPPILRRGANRGFHAAVGLAAELAATQVSYLQEIGLMPTDSAPDQVRWLLSQALTGPVVYLPFACGTVAHWEHDFYEQELPRHLFNERWWQHAARFQGIAPPTVRGEDHCDPAALPELHTQPTETFDLAISYLIRHQLHRFICEEILQEDVHTANWQGNLQIGVYLDSILAAGATRDWNQLLREATGRELSASAMLDYYEPLLAWLSEQNAGRTTSWR